MSNVSILKNNRKKVQREDLIFYILMLVYPIAQFCVFYLYVNANAFLLPFQKIDIATNTTTWNLDAMKEAIRMTFVDESFMSMRLMSLLIYAFGVVVNMPLAIFCSYYIYKKLPMGGMFRVILYLPCIISSIVLSGMFQYFVERAYPEFINLLTGQQVEGLLENKDTRLITLLLFGTFVGLGANMLLYTDSMSAIDQELVEAAHIDGAVGIREFWHVTLPGIYPLLTTFIITGVVGMFTADCYLYNFYGTNAPADLQTYGYWIYVKTMISSESYYPTISALGLILTIFAVPLTFLVRYLLERFGPSED